MPDDSRVLFQYGDALLREAATCGMPVTGSLQLHYRCDGVQQPGEVHLALPVQSFIEDYDGFFHLKRTESFFCVMDVHPGGFTRFEDRWSKLERCLRLLHLVPGSAYREILTSTEDETHSGCRILQREALLSEPEKARFFCSRLSSRE